MRRETITSSNLVTEFEVNQARFRVVNVLPFCIYLLLAWYFHWQQVRTSLAIGSVGYIAYAVIWFLIVCRAKAPSPTRRVIAAISDQALPALALYLAGFLGGYVAWVSALGSIGSGLRFGTQYTWLSVAVGAPLLSTAFFLSPEWRTIPQVATGVVLANVFIPLYAVLLVKRFEERNNKLQQQATYFEAASKRDALTGLLNRTGFMSAFMELRRRAVEQEQKLAVLVLDLDGFKLINDTCGHAAGDEMLKRISASLSEQLRDSDQIGRLGGDEFGIVLPNVKNQTDVEYLATELLSAIEDVAIPGIPLKVSASIGACLVSRHTSEAGEQIIAEADRLMYEAKVAGKKQFRIRDEFPI
jgi:diguanylate cyclase (GGDEF)-like protein